MLIPSTLTVERVGVTHWANTMGGDRRPLEAEVEMADVRGNRLTVRWAASDGPAPRIGERFSVYVSPEAGS